MLMTRAEKVSAGVMSFRPSRRWYRPLSAATRRTSSSSVRSRAFSRDRASFSARTWVSST